MDATNGDGDQPTAERPRLFQRGNAVRSIDERLLNDVVQVCIIPHQPVNDAGDIPRVARIKLGKRGFIGILSPNDDIYFMVGVVQNSDATPIFQARKAKHAP